MTPTPAKLGLIAGGGSLPILLAQRCRAAGRPLFVLRLKGFADPALSEFEGAEAGIAELGRLFELLRQAGVGAVCLAGIVNRPDFAALKPDLRGLKAIPGAIAAAAKGDDALLRFVVGEFEREGFDIEGADQVDAGLTLPPGSLGRIVPTPEQAADIAVALAAARAVGLRDLGQGAVAVGGRVVAEEGLDGTDAMLRRCAEGANARGGILAKVPKPIQERRVDLPVIGVATMEGAAAAGLAGVAGEAGSVLVLDRAAVVAAADRLGLFVVGIPAP